MNCPAGGGLPGIDTGVVLPVLARRPAYMSEFRQSLCGRRLLDHCGAPWIFCRTVAEKASLDPAPKTRQPPPCGQRASCSKWTRWPAQARIRRAAGPAPCQSSAVNPPASWIWEDELGAPCSRQGARRGQRRSGEGVVSLRYVRAKGARTRESNQSPNRGPLRGRSRLAPCGSPAARRWRSRFHLPRMIADSASARRTVALSTWGARQHQRDSRAGEPYKVDLSSWWSGRRPRAACSP